ncbi:MAG TPA: carboxypeptidase regulatory-like domain-containing protein, partial [Pyrinomonadaceae bacterium]
MNRFYAVSALLIALFSAFAAAQETTSNNKNSIKVSIKNEETKEAVAGATVTVKDTEITKMTGADGKAKLAGISDGEQTIEIFSPGYEAAELKL